MAEKPEISRRAVLGGAIAAILAGNRADAQTKGISEAPVNSKGSYLADTPEMEHALINIKDMRDGIRVKIFSGVKLQQLSEPQLKFLRGDEDLLKQILPGLNAEQCSRIKPLLLFSKKRDVISIENTGGVLTAERKNPDTGIWERAGFSLPKGVEMTEEEAFRAAARQRIRLSKDTTPGLGV